MNNSSLDRLEQIKKEADKIKESVRLENNTLKEKKKELSERILNDFCEELKQLSKYGSAGDTGYTFEYIGEQCKVYHEATEDGFKLTYYLPGSGFRSGKYNELYAYGGTYWGAESLKIKEYIVFHKEEILDNLTNLIVENMRKNISDTSLMDENEKLKKDVDYLEKKINKS